LEGWQTDSCVADEWIAASDELALKDTYGEIIPVQDFFNIMPFKNGWVKVGEQTISHIETDVFDIGSGGGTVRIDLNEDMSIPITLGKNCGATSGHSPSLPLEKPGREF
jgi:hypothetical protein